MRVRVILPRLALVLPLAAVLAAALAQSSLLKLFPVPSLLLVGYAALAILLALVPALLSSGSPLPGALGVVVPVLAAASYDQSRLDWLRLLKDYGVAGPGVPSGLRLALGLLALLLAWALHAMDASLRLRESALARGFPREQALGATRLVRSVSARFAGIAVAGAVVAGALTLLAARLPTEVLFGGRGSLIAPLLAVALLAIASLLVWGRGARAPE